MWTSLKRRKMEEEGSVNTEEILAKFVVEYDKMSGHGRRFNNFPLSWNRNAFDILSEPDKRDFIERAKTFLEEVARQRVFFLHMEEEKRAKEEALQKRLDELRASGVTTKSLLQRFSACTPEERTYVFRWVFNETAKPKDATWKFYARWACVEETREKNKKEYLENVDKLCNALKTFE